MFLVINNIFDDTTVNAPLQVFWGLTYNCNLKCPHCYAKVKKNSASLTLNQAYNLIEQFDDLGVFKIVLTHGENLLHHHFWKIIKKIKEKNISCILLSNGLTIGQNTSSKLKENRIDRVFISVDSPNSNEHDKFRGVSGLWKKAIKSLKLLKADGVKIGCATTLTKLNYNKIKELVDLAIKVGCNEISFLTLRPGLNQDSILLANYDHLKVYNEIINLKYKLRDKINIVTHDPLIFSLLDKKFKRKNIYNKVIDENQCGAGKYFLSITPDGLIYPCNFLPYRVGDISRPIKETWEKSEILANLRRVEITKKCLKCNYFNNCRGGCKSFAYYSNNSKIDPRCNIIK